jgi:hypothetical protein
MDLLANGVRPPAEGRLGAWPVSRLCMERANLALSLP